MIAPYAIAGGVSLALLAGVYTLGRSHGAQACLEDRLEESKAAVEEKADDNAVQSGAAAEDDERLQEEIWRLRRELDGLDVKTGLDCDAPGSGDSVHDAFDQLFEAGMPPVD